MSERANGDGEGSSEAIADGRGGDDEAEGGRAGREGTPKVKEWARGCQEGKEGLV